ncbi:hypothetical protein B0F90DRAFT_570808 [Multifurca ochricompacta]|uniref:F-box domain-containing protein n=1 Tax=Multifurca ochricompacta TaxID=376703 RepID=A0AAD4M3I4_9AGAM|nr:hypothetical protein B0F90DRAFT_570808 [Multifurca ochricompacta]
MEAAKTKDASSSEVLNTLKESLRAKRTEDDRPEPTKIVNFFVLSSLPDLGHRVVRLRLSARSGFPEIIWKLSRFKDGRRISPMQNPCFYQNIPASVEEYDVNFKMYPVRDLQAALKYDTIYVLTDKPGRVSFESETIRKWTFGNIWMPKDALIFKDIFGMLVGERTVGMNAQRVSDLHFWQSVDLPIVRASSTSHAGAALASYSSQPRTVTGLLSYHHLIAGDVFEDWRDLVCRTWDTHNSNRAGQTPKPAEHLVLPPMPPVAEQPDYPVLYTTVNTLNDDVLLSIFDSYRLDDEENWNLQLRWSKLAHVCRRWRYLIYASPSYLNLQLLCTNGTPVADMLAHSPPLPLIINYQITSADMAIEDEGGILLALQQRERVRRVELRAPSPSLHKLLTAMGEHFPSLEHLSLLSTTEGDSSLVLPGTFLAPSLHRLILLGVSLSTGLLLLTSTTTLVTLTLTDIRTFAYFPPQHLVAQLQFIPLLEELSIGFSIPIPRPSVQRELLRIPITHVALPALKRLAFRGVNAYFEGLVARITAPVLRWFDVTLFNQLTFTLTYLSRFIDTTAELRFALADVNFNQNSISISGGNHSQIQGDSSFHLRVISKQFDWQVSSAAQVCNALGSMLSAVEVLTLESYQQRMPPEWQNEVDDAVWYELLRPFDGVKKLCIGQALSSELCRALQIDGAELARELLPGLQELVLRPENGCTTDAFTTFMKARQLAGQPIRLVVGPLVRLPRTYTISPPMTFRTRMVGSYPHLR